MAISYDELANDFDERYRRQSFPGIQARLRRLVSSPSVSKVLEVGCGTGHWLSILSDLPIELTGVDPSRAMLEKARRRVARAQLVCASAENIPFPGGSFDLIFCVNAFHHFSDPKKFLRDSRLLLRNGGQLAIFGLDPHAPNTDWYLCDYFPGVRAVDLKRYLPVAEVERLMAEAGFSNPFRPTCSTHPEDLYWRSCFPRPLPRQGEYITIAPDLGRRLSEGKTSHYIRSPEGKAAKALNFLSC
jgi:ubiquinone/menaquinone biosynthesis C-methylase UbiE